MRREHVEESSPETAAVRADTGHDEVYDRRRADFGGASPKASGYLSDHAFFRLRVLVLEVVGAAPGTILDVACGGGLITAPLAEAGRRVVGVDFNAAACRHARRNRVEAVRGNAFDLPLADGVADVVLNVGFMQEAPPEAFARVLVEAARVLRPGGRLVIVWPNRRSLVHRMLIPISRVLDRVNGRTSFELFHHPVAEMRAAAERAGLAVDRVFAFFPPLSLRLRRVDGFLAGVVGSSFVAAFRKPAAP